MLGYRVFRGNLKKEEVSQITISPINSTTYIDTVQIKSLNNKVYYQIVAVDQRFNMSAYSEKIELRKPDVVPPSSPIFSNYKVSKDGVYLKWINSTSNDLQNHQLYRQNIKEANKGWQLIFKTDTISSFTDKKVENGLTYRYAIFAEDESGLQSEPTTPITLSIQKNDKEQVIKGLTVYADRTSKNINLSWRVISNQVSELLIYKNIKDQPAVLWKQISSSVNKITDHSVSPGNVYVYSVKAITKNSTHSELLVKEVSY